MTDQENQPLVNVKRDGYQKSKTASGSSSLNNGDEVAVALEGLTNEEVFQLADQIIPDNDFTDRYSKLNPGMQRMNIGNRLRGFRRADEKNAALFDRKAKPFTKAAETRAKGEAKAKEAAAKEAAAIAATKVKDKQAKKDARAKEAAKRAAAKAKKDAAKKKAA